MEALKQILISHRTKYPLMQPADAVKLLYQSEFGGGHMIRDTASCMDYLRKEYEQTEKDPSLALLEPIGCGMVRVSLAALPPQQVEDLGRAFIRSANAHTGSLSGFLEKIRVLSRLTESGEMPFTPAALESYLAEYARAGYPPVSHSQVYRQNYRPAYRVVAETYL